jgi:hypothetical protein
MKTLIVLLLIYSGMQLLAQNVSPRRWSHLPQGAQFLGAGFACTDADIYFDPLLQAENVTAEIFTIPAAYIYSFDFMKRSARVDVTQIYQQGEWKGLLNGLPARVTREGFGDTQLRFAVNLYGAPPLAGKEYMAYRQQQKTETLIGAGLLVVAPTGEYFPDKLINLGNNRWEFHPQLGLVHTRNRWTYEVTSAVWFFTENKDFWQNSTRKQDPLLALQGHVIYTYRPGCWFAGSMGYGNGAENTVNGVDKADRSENLIWAFSAGLPIDRVTGIKLAWVDKATKSGTGSDSRSILLSVSRMF